MKRNWKVGALLAALGVVAGCEYFYDVVVPASDATAPMAWQGVYRDEYQELDTRAFDYEVLNPSDVYFAVSAGTDTGGTRRVEMYPSVRWYCTNGTYSTLSSTTMATIVDTQAGTVGSTVSNGLYVGAPVRFATLATCSSGWTVSYAEYTWTSKVWDFHGNTATHPGATIFYDP